MTKEKTMKYLLSAQETSVKLTAKCVTAAPCFNWETWLTPFGKVGKIPIHPNSQAEVVSVAIWYYSNKEQMVVQVQDIFLAAP